MKSKSPGRNHPRNSPRENASTLSGRKNDLLIAAVGASAGGIEAFTELVSNLPIDTGMAFVLVQHLDPEHHSMLTELLSKKTAMRVKEVTNGMTVEPNHIYVIPPNATMSISNHNLQLAPRGDSRGAHMSIDHFMRALAEEQGTRAIGVILSGSGTDGTAGLAEIQAHGGVTFAQDMASAKYDAMPRSAIAAECVDQVLSPKAIARELARIARHPYIVRDQSPELAPAENNGFSLVFQLLRKSTGVDFTHYRQTTIIRRIQRRMVVHKMEKIDEYVKYLQTNPVEIKALYQDMLINVTSFFRNPKMFEALKTDVFPSIVKIYPPEGSLRIWTPGCASGEETYSIAIALLEFLGDKASQTHIQFFGTDISESSVAKARSGIYPENIQADVSPERLRRFFTKVEGGYRISKTIRDMCIFAQHNVLHDPPFSQMDLTCCRNLLIYLEPVLQNKIISLFHYATRHGGYLILGTSEGIGTSTNLFSIEDRANKIFLKKSTAVRQPVTFSLASPGDRHDQSPFGLPSKQPDTTWNYLEAQKEFDRRLLNQYAPATVFINEDLEIIHTRGSVNRYLKLAPGRASLSILKMAREGLLVALRNALAKAKKDNVTVRKQNVQIKNGNGNGAPDSVLTANFEVVPVRMGNLKELYFMIVFEEPIAPPHSRATRSSKRVREAESAVSGRIAKLEQELAATKEYLQSVIETQEATNEELQSANEEILSSNEELQSTNEELETAKEELQSANEELSTVNDELRSRNQEVTQINNDLTNLFAGIDFAVVIVGSDLSIRRFTPQAEKVLGLIIGDVGRPLLSINPAIEIPELHSLVVEVMTNLRHQVDREITNRQGSRYKLRILPYRTADNKIDGAIITVIDFSSYAAGNTA
ncbi:MAG TPA: chemotaxis protein CheB [Candidatus Acidoferrum sp.]|nr:chemotaxis protein CheB [Candidatus Acidoferrum sp.]